MELYSIENFHFTYQGAAGEALGGVNLTVNSGDFVLLCGTSGCGKTTLLRHMKRALAPYGQQSGRILYKGTPVDALDDETAAFEIGFVMQNPDEQIVCDKVYKELAFGLESMGVENGIIRRRVAEDCQLFRAGELVYARLRDAVGRTEADFKPCIRYGDAAGSDFVRRADGAARSDSGDGIY